MKKLLMSAVVLILVSVASWAQAATPGMRTGQWLHSLWESLQKAETADEVMILKQRLILYNGYVEGAAAVMWAAGWLNLSNVTWAHEAIVVGTYLNDHPDQWNLDAVTLVYRALHKLWPGKIIAPYQ